MYELIQGDSLEVMNRFEPDSFDALVTDPPWGIGKKYGFWREPNDAESYWKWFEPFYVKALNLIKPGGLITIWQSSLYFEHFWEWFGKGIHIYISAKNFVSMRGSWITHAYDPVVIFHKSGKMLLPKNFPIFIQRKSFDYFIANIAKPRSEGKSNLHEGHPFPRPLDQAIEIMYQFVPDNALVLDPFAGSGTIPKAAILTGRSCIGIELNESYMEIARATCEQAIKARNNIETFL